MPRRPKPKPCTLPHIQAPPDPRDYTWPLTCISAATLDHIIYSQLRDVEPRLLTSNFKYFRGDSNMWACDPDLMFDILQWGHAIKLQGSPEVTVTNPAWLQPGTNIIYTNPDGSVVVSGQTGQCDNTSVLAHADMVRCADETRIGFDFASGFLWQYAPRGHSPNWMVDTNLKFWIMQAGRPRETFLIDPATVPGLQIHFIYEA